MITRRRLAWVAAFSPLLLIAAVYVGLASRRPPLFSAGRIEGSAFPADHLRILLLGDTGHGNPTQMAVADGAKRWCDLHGCDLVLIAGDLLYPNGMEGPEDPRADGWIADPYRPIGAPIGLAVGNHDYAQRHDALPVQWLVDWASREQGILFPEPTWELVTPLVHLVTLDTDRIFWHGEADQGAWVDEHLAKATAPWRIVLGHHPYVSDGKHGNAGSYEGTTGVPWLSGRGVKSFYDAHICGKADLLMVGHDHIRQHLTACGMPELLSGAGSDPAHLVGRGNAAQFSTAAPGSIWIELRADGGEVVFVSESGAEEARQRLDPPRPR